MPEPEQPRKSRRSDSRYRAIPVTLWDDERFRHLSKAKPNAQTAYLYLRTGPHTTSVPGLSSIGEAAVAERLGWALPLFRRAFGELEVVGLAKADWSARVVWLPDVIRDEMPRNPNQVTGWLYHLAEIPECRLKHEAIGVLAGVLEVLGKQFQEPFRKQFGQLFGVCLATQDQDQDQDQEVHRSLRSRGAVKRAAPFQSLDAPGLERYVGLYRDLYGDAPEMTPEQRADLQHVLARLKDKALGIVEAFMRDPGESAHLHRPDRLLSHARFAA